jgi:hypothetical protein
MLFVAVIRLIPSLDGDTFASRTQDSFYGFVNLATIGLPLLAVLLATHLTPVHPRAKLITTVALAEYAVAAFFALLFGILIGLINVVGYSVRVAFEEFLVRGAWLAVFGIAAFAVFQVWRNLFFVPRPKPQPGMYGQPAPGQPGFGQPGSGQPAYGQQPGYGQPAWNQPAPTPGQSGYPPVGQPYATQPFGQTGPGQPAPEQPRSAPPAPPGPFAPEPGHSQGAAPYSAPHGGGTYGGAPAPYSAPPSVAPTSGTHGDGVYGAAPGYSPPAPSGAYSDPTEVVPRPGEIERTQMINPEHGEPPPYR